MSFRSPYGHGTCGPCSVLEVCIRSPVVPRAPSYRRSPQVLQREPQEFKMVQQRSFRPFQWVSIALLLGNLDLMGRLGLQARVRTLLSPL